MVENVLSNNSTEHNDVLGEATFYHSLKWKQILSEEFKFQQSYIHVTGGLLPSFILKFGPLKTCISLPNSDYGGPIAKDVMTCMKLYHALASYCSDQDIIYARMCLYEPLHIKFFKPISEYSESVKGVMELDLSRVSSNFIWNHVFSRKTRKDIRQLERSRYQAYELTSMSEMPEFYRIYNMNIRYVGGIPYNYSFLRRIWQYLYPLNVRVWLMGKKAIVGGLLALRDKQASYAYLLGIDRENAPNFSIFQYLFWRELLKAETEGLKRFSLGSTPSDPDELHYKVKRSLGATFHPQEVVWIPTNARGHLLLQIRGRTQNLWKASRNYFPREGRRIIESRLIKL